MPYAKALARRHPSTDRASSVGSPMLRRQSIGRDCFAPRALRAALTSGASRLFDFFVWSIPCGVAQWIRYRANSHGQEVPRLGRTRPQRSAVVATVFTRHSSRSAIVVTQSIQYRKRDGLSSVVGRGGSCPQWYPLTDSSLRPRCVEIWTNVLAEHASQLVFAENDDVIQTFASNSTKKPLTD
jgi:hypothetical protein